MWELLLKFGPLLAGPLAQLIPILDVRKYWKVYGVLFLVCVQLITAYGWNSDHKALGAERASHRADIKSFKDAQVEAQKKIEAKKQQLEQESKAKSNAADKNYSTLLAKYHASILRYKALESLRSGPSSGEQSKATQGDNGPSTSTELPATLTISGADAEICAVNTARLQAAHDWATQK